MDEEEILVGKIICGFRELEDNVSRKLLTNLDGSYLKILVGKIIWGFRKWEDNISRKLLTSLDDSYLNRSVLNSPKKYLFRGSFWKFVQKKKNRNIIPLKITNMKHWMFIYGTNNQIWGVWTNDFYEDWF